MATSLILIITFCGNVCGQLSELTPSSHKNVIKVLLKCHYIYDAFIQTFK